MRFILEILKASMSARKFLKNQGATFIFSPNRVGEPAIIANFIVAKLSHAICHVNRSFIDAMRVLHGLWINA